MNIERFIEARKAMGLSQNELAKGICTQATLSRFENNGQVPTLKILIKLCNRLELPLGELFPKAGVQHPEIIEKMDQAEFFLITSEYEQLADILKMISIETVQDTALLLRYYYLKGYVMIFQNEAATDVLFNFDKLLMEEEKTGNEIYRLLAYTGIGMVYARDNDQEKAEFYFNKVFQRIYHYPITSTEDTWRVLNIVFHCGMFYAENKDLDTSNALLEYAIVICSDNHITYYLARAAFQLAKNAICQKRPQVQIVELLQDARAYAKINKNNILLEEIKKTKEGLPTSEK